MINLSIFIDTGSNRHLIKTYSKSEKAFQSLILAWENAKDKQPLSPQKLLDLCNQNERQKSIISITQSPANILDCENSEVSGFPRKISSRTPSDDLAPPLYNKPDAAVTCSCKDHYEKIELDEIIVGSAKDVHDILYGSRSNNFWEYLDQKCGITGNMGFIGRTFQQ
jgi:hypothetical protein